MPKKLLRPFSKEKFITKSNNDIPTTSNLTTIITTTTTITTPTTTATTLNFKPSTAYQSNSNTALSTWYEAPRHDDPALYTALFKRKFVKVFALPKSWENSVDKRQKKINNTSENKTINLPLTENLASSVPASTSLCITKTKSKDNSTLFLAKLPQDLTRSLSNQLNNIALNKENSLRNKDDLIPISLHSINSTALTIRHSPCLKNCLECDDKASKPRVSNITFSTVTSATGLPTIAAEPSRLRSSSYWKPQHHSHSNVYNSNNNASRERVASTTASAAVASTTITTTDEKSTALNVKIANNEIIINEKQENSPNSILSKSNSDIAINSAGFASISNKNNAQLCCSPTNSIQIDDKTGLSNCGSVLTNDINELKHLSPPINVPLKQMPPSIISTNFNAQNIKDPQASISSNEEKITSTKSTPLLRRKKRVITIIDDDELQSDEQSNISEDSDSYFVSVQTTDGTVFTKTDLDRDSTLKRITEWSFPIFQFSNQYKKTVLSRMAYSIFKHSDLFRIFKLEKKKFFNFFHSLESGYWDIPYHNRIHAADVLHGCFYLTCHPIHAFSNSITNQSYNHKHYSSQRHPCSCQQSIDKSNDNNDDSNEFDSDEEEDEFNNIINEAPLPLSHHMSTLEVMALYTAAAMHDYDHPGKTNAFLVAIEDEKAIMYNDRSVLENHHAAESWRLLMKEENKFIMNLDAAEFKRFRYLVLEYILATDLKQHFDIILEFNDKLADIDLTNESHRLIVYRMLIKFADINSPSKPYPLHRQWTERICKEFYEQGDEEKFRNMPVSPYMDRNQPAVAKLQDSFITHMVNPLAVALNEANLLPILPGLTESELIINLKHNHQKWLQEIEDTLIKSPDDDDSIKNSDNEKSVENETNLIDNCLTQQNELTLKHNRITTIEQSAIIKYVDKEDNI